MNARTLYSYAGCCVNLVGDDIKAMCRSAYQITRRSFIKWAGKENASPPGDWAVRYYRSRFKGRPCVYMDHSAIEYVYCKNP